MVTRAWLSAWPWAGFLLGGLGLILTHQVGADGNHDACQVHGWPDVLAMAVLGLLLAGGGAFLSWRLWKRGDGHETATRRFIACVSMGAAALFSFAMLLPVLAAFLIPRCFG